MALAKEVEVDTRPFMAAAALLTFLSPWRPAAGAEELKVPFVRKDACPFEGCTYGKWPVRKEATIHSDPDRTATVIAILTPGQEVNAVTGEVHVVPGRARVVGKPHKSASDLDPTREFLILDYMGEGYSAVYQAGRFSSVKIARTKKRCQENPDLRWRECWAEIIEEPSVDWWVLIKTLDGQHEGWVLMEGGVLEAIDRFSKQRRPANNAIKLAGLSLIR